MNKGEKDGLMVDCKDKGVVIALLLFCEKDSIRCQPFALLLMY